MADVEGNQRITLRPGDSITYQFQATVCSALTANDGTLPYGRSISSVTVKAYNFKGVEKTSEIVGQAAVANNIISAVLTYPTTSGGGRYQLRFACTLDNAQVLNLRFDYLEAVEDN